MRGYDFVYGRRVYNGFTTDNYTAPFLVTSRSPSRLLKITELHCFRAGPTDSIIASADQLERHARSDNAFFRVALAREMLFYFSSFYFFLFSFLRARAATARR